MPAVWLRLALPRRALRRCGSRRLPIDLVLVIGASLRVQIADLLVKHQPVGAGRVTSDNAFEGCVEHWVLPGRLEGVCGRQLCARSVHLRFAKRSATLFANG